LEYYVQLSVIAGFFVTSSFQTPQQLNSPDKNSDPFLLILCFCRYPFGRNMICSLKLVYLILLGLSWARITHQSFG